MERSLKRRPSVLSPGRGPIRFDRVIRWDADLDRLHVHGPITRFTSPARSEHADRPERVWKARRGEGIATTCRDPKDSFRQGGEDGPAGVDRRAACTHTAVRRAVEKATLAGVESHDAARSQGRQGPCPPG